MIFRWLGVAGIELRVSDTVLVIDPYFTRATFRYVWWGRVFPDVQKIKRHLPTCDYVLITHPHWDHVMDAGEILRYSGAQGYGSLNACRLMVITGASGKNVHEIKAGDHLKLGPFSIDVAALGHRWTPINRWINGNLRPDLEAPLKLLDYRMDASYGFLIQAEGWKLLVGDLPMAADVLFTVPLNPMDHYKRLLASVQPKLVIPIHWDDLFHPSAMQARPIFTLPRLGWPPLQRFDIYAFERMFEMLSSSVRLLIPNPFHHYVLEDEVGLSK